MLTFEPIGYVHNEITFGKRDGWGQVESSLVLDERYTDALDGLEEFSHVLVIFCFDRVEPPQAMKRHVREREELPIIGLFAGHGPSRPNPIGVSAVPIVGRDRNLLRVRSLEALNDTPILDIKP